MNAGTRVRHAEHGSGEIVELRRGGRIAVVRFDGHALPLTVPARDLGGAPARSPVVESPELAGSYDDAVARRTLEAMRLGVVPDAELSAYTVGRDAEMALVESDLDAAASGEGAVRAFLGDYGAGKTHLLELIQYRALDRGFLSAQVVLGPKETPPSHPKRVYRALVRGLRYPDRPHEEDAGLEPLLERAVDNADLLAQFGVEPRATGGTVDERLAAGEHLYVTAALDCYRQLSRLEASPGLRRKLRDVPPALAEGWLRESRDLLLDWIEGHPTFSNRTIERRLTRLPGRHARVYSLIDYRPWARIYGYVLTGLSTLARAAGYRGLVVTLDEAEFYALLSRENRGFARHLFRAWTYAAVGEAGGALPFETGVLNIGGFGVQRRLPGRFGAGPGLYLAFAMTPSSDGVEALEGAVPADRVHTLAPLGGDDHRNLAARVCDFYASARPDWGLPEMLVAPLGKVLAGLVQSGYVSNPRQAMKFIIEFLDVVRFHPESVGDVVRNLQLQIAG